MTDNPDLLGKAAPAFQAWLFDRSAPVGQAVARSAWESRA